MPELPEVETTRRGLEPHLLGRTVRTLVLRRANLRWEIPNEVQQLLGQPIEGLERRAKYLLMHTPAGSALLHLGMSGNLRLLPESTALKVHDHVDIGLDNGQVLRFNDPRRFGCLLWQPSGTVHALLTKLGPEPLSEAFHVQYLYELSRNRAVAVKHLLMDQSAVVGVGNIYVAEALFRAGIRPARAAGRVSRAQYQRIVVAIKSILCHAIERGGTTLRDFLQPDGEPGYFAQELYVYGREGLPCRVCATPIRAASLGPRQSCFCPTCQK